MTEVIPLTDDQRAELLFHLREGHLLAGAMQLGGITREQLELCGQAFADECQFAYEQGTAALDRQATALGLAGVPCSLLAFILRSRHRRYSEQPAVAVNLGIEPAAQPERSGDARQRLSEMLDAIHERLLAGPSGAPDQPCAGARAAPPEADDPDPQDHTEPTPAAPPSAASPDADAVSRPVRSFVEEEVARVGFWWPSDQ